MLGLDSNLKYLNSVVGLFFQNVRVF